jgi:hypothetical protein
MCCVCGFDKKGLDYILGDFLANLCGHPILVYIPTQKDKMSPKNWRQKLIWQLYLDSKALKSQKITITHNCNCFATEYPSKSRTHGLLSPFLATLVVGPQGLSFHRGKLDPQGWTLSPREFFTHSLTPKGEHSVMFRRTKGWTWPPGVNFVPFGDSAPLSLPTGVNTF